MMRLKGVCLALVFLAAFCLYLSGTAWAAGETYDGEEVGIDLGLGYIEAWKNSYGVWYNTEEADPDPGDPENPYHPVYSKNKHSNDDIQPVAKDGINLSEYEFTELEVLYPTFTNREYKYHKKTYKKDGQVITTEIDEDTYADEYVESNKERLLPIIFPEEWGYYKEQYIAYMSDFSYRYRLQYRQSHRTPRF